MGVLRDNGRHYGPWLGGCGGACCNSKQQRRTAKKMLKRRQERAWRKDQAA